LNSLCQTALKAYRKPRLSATTNVRVVAIRRAFLGMSAAFARKPNMRSRFETRWRLGQLLAKIEREKGGRPRKNSSRVERDRMQTARFHPNDCWLGCGVAARLARRGSLTGEEVERVVRGPSPASVTVCRT
jgi:hypothetical protein